MNDDRWAYVLALALAGIAGWSYWLIWDELRPFERAVAEVILSATVVLSLVGIALDATRREP